MVNIVLTGAKGTIGTVLRKSLSGYTITPLDLPEHDVCTYDLLLKTFKGQDAVIHLAWDTLTENGESKECNPDNVRMFWNVYRAAVEAKVPRVIMASSVHVENYYEWKGPELLTSERIELGPRTPYGVSKLHMEELGRYFAKHEGLEVLCVRFGGVTPEDAKDLPIPGC